MGTLVVNVQGSNSSDTATYSFSNVASGDLIQSAAFGYLGVQINQERVRRSQSALATIKDSADYAGTIDYAEMEKLRSAVRVAGPVNPTYKNTSNQDITFTQATAAFAGDPGAISAAGSWTGKPKITAALFNTIIQGLKNQGAECVCNCNYCTCNCNYCTCNCNFSCTCNCNYSDVTTKNNIVYM